MKIIKMVQNISLEYDITLSDEAGAELDVGPFSKEGLTQLEAECRYTMEEVLVKALSESNDIEGVSTAVKIGEVRVTAEVIEV